MIDRLGKSVLQIRGIRGYCFCNQLRSVAWISFSGKLYRLSVCFNRGVWFDTPKNRVVTSSVIWLFGESSSIQIIEEPLDTAQFKE